MSLLSKNEAPCGKIQLPTGNKLMEDEYEKTRPKKRPTIMTATNQKTTTASTKKVSKRVVAQEPYLSVEEYFHYLLNR